MIRIVEVGPRDGLQNETETVPAAAKVAFIDALSASGVDEIEVTSFVSAKRVPQLADAEQVFSQIKRRDGVSYSALVPNEQGLERALPLKPDRVAVFTAASETFSQKNVNASIDETFERFVPVIQGAKQAGIAVRGYVSMVFWCPYEGKIEPEDALKVTERLLELGCEEISLGDTVGKATPEEVHEVLDVILARVAADKLALHFHDTYGRAARNVIAGYEKGIRVFDSAAGGLGGCPYAPGAPGNIATEVMVRALREAGAEVSTSLDALAVARRVIAEHIATDRMKTS